MNYKVLSFLFISAILSHAAIAQNISNTRANSRDNNPERKYMRPSVTIISTDRGTARAARMNKLIANTPVPGKFNDHNVSANVIKVKTDVFNARSAFEPVLRNEVARQMVAKWFNRNERGEFSMDLIGDRGMYSATDADVLKAKASQRRLDLLRDAGENLLDRTYILVYDVKAIYTADEYADRVTRPKDKEGYVAFYDCYLYKLDWNDSVAAVFYNNMWIDASSYDAEKVALFNNTKFPIQYITAVTNAFGAVEATQYKDHSRNLFGSLSDEELFTEIFEEIVKETNVSLAQVNEDFKVKAPVFSTRPIAAKIGLKEGLSVDKRFFAYEYELDRDGKKVAKRKAVVRASSRISDNRKVADGSSDTSVFYQVAGGKVYEGMLLQENPDWGMGFTIGTMGTLADNVNGLSLSFELSLSQWGGRALKGTAMPSGLKAYINGNIGLPGYKLIYSPNSNTTFEYSRASFSIGLSKDFYFFRCCVLVPFAGYGVETFTNSDSDFDTDKYQTEFIQLGARLGINIVHNVQLMGSIYFNTVISSEAQNNNDDATGFMDNTVEFIKTKSANEPYMNIGLRFMF